nr:ABC transporter ATP-binding protein [Maliibacterium massiliense]
MIQFVNVSKRFKETTVLHDISFEIPEGNLVAIIGESGCGKTTTLKMINRLIKPSSGQIFIKGEDIAEKDVIALRRDIGYVIQQTGLFPHMTVRENIELIPRVQKRARADIAKRTLELMEMVGLHDESFLERYPTELSGGQQQRVGVARAFATDPEIVLMDEPFSALDPITRSQLQDELIALQAQLHKTIVFVTHDMDEAIKIADRICIMRDGHILQYDTPEHILKNPEDDFVCEFVGKKRIWTSPEFIKAKDIMIDRPVTCSPNAALFWCVQLMRTAKVDSLMVVDRARKLRGIVTARQVRHAKDQSVQVDQVMGTTFLHVDPEDSIVDILKLVDEKDISTVPVVDQAGRLNGLITKSSLVTTLSQQFLETEEA